MSRNANRPKLNRSVIEELIYEWVIGKNAERDRKILARRLFDGITFERLAEEFNLSVDQVKRIVYKRTQEIFKH